MRVGSEFGSEAWIRGSSSGLRQEASTTQRSIGSAAQGRRNIVHENEGPLERAYETAIAALREDTNSICWWQTSSISPRVWRRSYSLSPGDSVTCVPEEGWGLPCAIDGIH
jgi:hypothetical protein